MGLGHIPVTHIRTHTEDITTTGHLETKEGSGEESGVRAVNSLLSPLPVSHLAGPRLSQANSLLGLSPNSQLQLSWLFLFI